MMASAHALVGAAIVSKFTDPFISYPLIFVSHFILDAVPHWDFGTNWKKRSKSATGFFSITETLLGITVAYFAYQGKVSPLVLLIAIGISELPDWLEAPWYIFFASHQNENLGSKPGFIEKLAYYIYKAEGAFHNRLDLPWGLVTQIVVVGSLLYLLK